MTGGTFGFFWGARNCTFFCVTFFFFFNASSPRLLLGSARRGGQRQPAGGGSCALPPSTACPGPPPHSALAPALPRRWRRRRASARSPHKRRRDKHPPPAGTKDGSAGRDSDPSRSPGSPSPCSPSLRNRLPGKRRGAPSTVPLSYYCGGDYFPPSAHLTVHILVS